MLENLSDFLGIEEAAVKTEYKASADFRKENIDAFADKLISARAKKMNNVQPKSTHTANEFYSLEQYVHLSGNTSSGWTCIACGKIGNAGSICETCHLNKIPKSIQKDV